MRNRFSFVPKGQGADGLSVLEARVPTRRTVRARLWLKHSRFGVRTAGDTLRQLGRSVDLLELPAAIAPGGPLTWWGIQTGASVGLGGVGELLRRLPDRDLGMVNLDEHFGPEFGEEGRCRRVASLSTGYGHVTAFWTLGKTIVAEPDTGVDAQDAQGA